MQNSFLGKKIPELNKRIFQILNSCSNDSTKIINDIITTIMNGQSAYSNTVDKDWKKSYSKNLTVFFFKSQILIFKTNILNIKLQKTYTIKAKQIMNMKKMYALVNNDFPNVKQITTINFITK